MMSVPPLENVPPELVRVVEHALLKSPTDRYPSAGEMLAELERLRGNSRVDPDAIAFPSIRAAVQRFNARQQARNLATKAAAEVTPLKQKHELLVAEYQKLKPNG